MTELEEKLHKIFHIRWILMLSTVPFMCICPLILTSLFTGFPYEVLQNNSKIKDYHYSFDTIEIPEETEQIGISVADLDNVDAAENCDIYAAKLVKTQIDEEGLSKLLLKDFQDKFSSIESSAFSELTYRSQLKLYPIDLTQNNYDNNELKFNLIKDFGITDNDRSKEGDSYLVYMINYNVFGSRDSRCN